MKRSADIRWAEMRIGVFLVVALVLLGSAIFFVGQKQQLFTPTTTVKVIVSDVQGLRVGAPVRLSGLVIGTVADIAFAEPLRSDRVTITLRLRKHAAQRLGSDAEVAIRTQGLLGEKYVDIAPGAQVGVPREPLTAVQPIDLDQVMTRANSAFARFEHLVEQLESPEGTLGRLVHDPALYDNLADLTARLRTLAEAATRGDGTMARLVNDPKLYKNLLAFSAQGQKAVARLDELTTSLQDPKGTVGRLIRDPELYEESLETVQRMHRSLDRLDALLVRIREGEGTAGRLVNDAQLYDQLLETLENLDALVRDLQEHPDRYVNFSLF